LLFPRHIDTYVYTDIDIHCDNRVINKSIIAVTCMP
jgi:hypothetical protein